MPSADSCTATKLGRRTTFVAIRSGCLAIETVWTDKDTQRLFPGTADLVRSSVELLVVTGGDETALQAALAASRTIPIVMLAINFDPIARGYVKSLAHPGGNITGVVSLQTELAAKQVELLTQAFPERIRLAVLWDAGSADQFAAAERQARSLRLDVRSLKLENPPPGSSTRKAAGGAGE